MTTITVIYSSSGSGSWLCPAGVTSVQVQAWGGGGGGSGGGGGGGGQYAAETAVAVTPGSQYPWTAGAGGNGGGGTSGGGNGGTSSFAGDSLTVTAPGGQGGGPGTAGSGSSGGPGGTGSPDSITFAGGSGGTVTSAGTAGAGGGSSGGTAAAGNNGGGVSGTSAGAGGAAVSGGGAGGSGGAAAADGNNGSAPGGGGGGSGHARFGVGVGGLGGDGQVILTYTAAFQPQVPVFPAGYAPLPGDFDNWIQAPLAFLTSKVMLRAELAGTQVLTANTSTLLPFNSILEDPFSGWDASQSQWFCPAGYSGTYEVTLTASCGPGIGSTTLVTPQVGVNSAAFLYTVDRAWVPGATVPGIASGSTLVQLYGGTDSVQGYAALPSGSGTNGGVVTTAGQRCELTISWCSL